MRKRSTSRCTSRIFLFGRIMTGVMQFFAEAEGMVARAQHLAMQSHNYSQRNIHEAP
jgi:hypothetical protein